MIIAKINDWAAKSFGEYRAETINDLLNLFPGCEIDTAHSGAILTRDGIQIGTIEEEDNGEGNETETETDAGTEAQRKNSVRRGGATGATKRRGGTKGAGTAPAGKEPSDETKRSPQP
jgi:hypothetical protein